MDKDLSQDILITGGAGFIGSHIIDKLSNLMVKIKVIDNLSSGNMGNLVDHIDNPYLKFIEADLKDSSIFKWFEDIDAVFHFAANPEVRVSITSPRTHFEENILTTFNVLEACRRYDVNYLVFASTSTVYGDAEQFPTPEDYSPLEPISVYGASKLACENLIITYSKLYDIKSLILRYANIIGPRSNHGVIIDFIKKLRINPGKLEILGDGSQRKSYLYISDAVDATLHLYKNILLKKVRDYEIYNVGNMDWITVKEIADIIVREMGLESVQYIFKPATSDGRGWRGDVKFMLLDITKLKSTGWRPRYNSREAVIKTLKELFS